MGSFSFFHVSPFVIDNKMKQFFINHSDQKFRSRAKTRTTPELLRLIPSSWTRRFVRLARIIRVVWIFSLHVTSFFGLSKLLFRLFRLTNDVNRTECPLCEINPRSSRRSPRNAPISALFTPTIMTLNIIMMPIKKYKRSRVKPRSFLESA